MTISRSTGKKRMCFCPISERKTVAQGIIRLAVACLLLLLAGTSCNNAGTTDNTTVPQEETGQPVVTINQDTGQQIITVDDMGTGAVSSEQSKYGGALSLAMTTEPSFDLLAFNAAFPQTHAHQKLFEGDWTKGNAGGYGEGLTAWGESTNIPDLNTGYLVSEYHWELSDDGSEVTTHFTLRDGICFSRPSSQAGLLVNGRELTVDDLVWNLNQRLHNENAQNYQLFPSYCYPEAVKTSINTFSITHDYDDHFSALTRENCSTYVFAPELWDAYGYDSCTDWNNSVGTGPYIITDYVQGIVVECTRNTAYWGKDPVGPDKGSQLPYIEKIRYVIMPDELTRQAAISTAKIDQISAFTAGDKDTMLAISPNLIVSGTGSSSETPLYMNTTVAPFSDINVRQAMIQAIDFSRINEELYGGQGDIVSWPYYRIDGYEPLFVSTGDTDLPAAIKELFTYDPEKAKILLSDAGYPNGFKTTLVCQLSDTGYYSIILKMWAEVGVEVRIQSLEYNRLMSTVVTTGYDGLIAVQSLPVSSFPEQTHYAARNWANASLINDPFIDEEAEKVRDLAVTDFYGSMELCRPLIMHLLTQAYVIPAPRYQTYTLWWPWLKNYSGESSVGYSAGNSWAEWCWIDKDMKAGMGY